MIDEVGDRDDDIGDYGDGDDDDDGENEAGKRRKSWM